MAKVTPVDCGQGQDCGEVIELSAKLYAVMSTEDGVQLNFAPDTSSVDFHQHSVYQFWLTPEEAWGLELEPGDLYDVLFIRRDAAGDNVSDQ